MGVAISGMHYTGMQAAIFTAHGEAQEAASFDQTNLALAVACITFFILALAFAASLSEQRRAEEALRQAQADLAHVNRVTTMGELTASLAHEVNQPIAAAVANASACLHWLAAQPPNLEEARAAAMNVVKAERLRPRSSATSACCSRKQLRSGSWSISTKSFERWSSSYTAR
jgi:signal transduction histidine kinase